LDRSGVNTFDRHLLREWLQIFAMTMIATCGLLCVHICHDDLRSLREAGARGMDLLRYVAVTMPSFATLVLPVGLLFSLLFVLTKMHRANEITAMRVAGVGFFRLTLPLWLVGVACCGLS
jgi:lipopolysaccharide export system permease protein